MPPSANGWAPVSAERSAREREQALELGAGERAQVARGEADRLEQPRVARPRVDRINQRRTADPCRRREDRRWLNAWSRPDHRSPPSGRRPTATAGAAAPRLSGWSSRCRPPASRRPRLLRRRPASSRRSSRPPRCGRCGRSGPADPRSSSATPRFMTSSICGPMIGQISGQQSRAALPHGCRVLADAEAGQIGVVVELDELRSPPEKHRVARMEQHPERRSETDSGHRSRGPSGVRLQSIARNSSPLWPPPDAQAADRRSSAFERRVLRHRPCGQS